MLILTAWGEIFYNRRTSTKNNTIHMQNIQRVSGVKATMRSSLFSTRQDSNILLAILLLVWERRNLFPFFSYIRMNQVENRKRNKNIWVITSLQLLLYLWKKGKDTFEWIQLNICKSLSLLSFDDDIFCITLKHKNYFPCKTVWKIILVMLWVWK